MSVLCEMRVGMSLYWVRLVRSGPGYRATWKQFGVEREVWSQGNQGDALSEAKELAGALDAEMAVVP